MGYNSPMRFSLKLVLCVGLLAGGLGLRAGLPGLESSLPTRLALDPTQAVGVVMSESWSVWRTQEMMGNRQRQDQRSVRSQVFRQRAGAEEAELIYESYQQQVPQPSGVLSDGTVLMITNGRRELLMVDRRGVERRIDLIVPGHESPQVQVHAVCDEGIFIQPSPHGGRHGNKTPLFFVPFRGGELDFDAATMLTAEEGIAYRARRSMARAWPRVAWFDDEHLYVFDLLSQEIEKLEFRGGKPEKGFDEVRGFDGRFVALRKLVIDTQSGRVVTAQNDNQPIVIRDGVMYEMNVKRVNNNRSTQLTLAARDLLNNPGKQVDLISVDGYDMYWSYGSRRQASPNMGPTIIQPTDQGLRMYDGEAWISVPYLERESDPQG